MGLFSAYDPEAFKYGKELYEKTVADLPSLEGKTVAITGCTTGLGHYLALAAARKGASRVLLLNRPSERATAAEAAIRDAATVPETVVQSVSLDLQSFASVREAAGKVAEVAAAQGGLDVLANNAGIMAMPDTRTADGYDVQMQTNQLSHVLLTKLLMPQLELAATSRGEARVVFHSSSARDMPGCNLAPRFFEACEAGTLGGDTVSAFREMVGWCAGGPWTRYHMSKLANAAYAMALHEQLQARGSKVKALAVDPGAATSELQRTSVTSGTMPNWMANVVMRGGQSAADGSTPLAMACFSLEAQSGDFFAPVGGFKGAPGKTISAGQPVKKGGEKLTVEKANQELAWRLSNTAAGPGPFFTE